MSLKQLATNIFLPFLSYYIGSSNITEKVVDSVGIVPHETFKTLFTNLENILPQEKYNDTEYITKLAEELKNAFDEVRAHYDIDSKQFLSVDKIKKLSEKILLEDCKYEYFKKKLICTTTEEDKKQVIITENEKEIIQLYAPFITWFKTKSYISSRQLEKTLEQKDRDPIRAYLNSKLTDVQGVTNAIAIDTNSFSKDVDEFVKSKMEKLKIWECFFKTLGLAVLVGLIFKGKDISLSAMSVMSNILENEDAVMSAAFIEGENTIISEEDNTVAHVDHNISIRSNAETMENIPLLSSSITDYFFIQKILYALTLSVHEEYYKVGGILERLKKIKIPEIESFSWWFDLTFFWKFFRECSISNTNIKESVKEIIAKTLTYLEGEGKKLKMEIVFDRIMGKSANGETSKTLSEFIKKDVEYNAEKDVEYNAETIYNIFKDNSVFESGVKCLEADCSEKKLVGLEVISPKLLLVKCVAGRMTTLPTNLELKDDKKSKYRLVFSFDNDFNMYDDSNELGVISLYEKSQTRK